jgi:integrase
MDDLDFDAKTIRVDEALDILGKIGPCKNAAAYRTVLLADQEGKGAMQIPKRFVEERIRDSKALVFSSIRNTPLRRSQFLIEGLHPALKDLGLPKDGVHAFRRGCNRRWELAGIDPAVIRTQMGHSSAAMTYKYTGQVPIDQVKAELSMRFGNKTDVLENKDNLENAAAA